MGVAKAPMCNLPLLYTTCRCVVPIIPLPGTTLPGFASRHVEQWFHISTQKLCYQSQLFTLQICGECFDEDEGDICFMLAEQEV
jgi:hypothetical protein